MESIDALAKAVNEFEGGMVLVSHDMRLISQVAKEIWICDDKTITQYRGDIMNFKMDMRRQMGIDGEGANSGSKLRGDASVKATEKAKKKPSSSKPEPTLEVVKPAVRISSISEGPAAPATKPQAPKVSPADDATAVTATTTTSAGSNTTMSNDAEGAPKRYIPPHLRKKMSS